MEAEGGAQAACTPQHVMRSTETEQLCPAQGPGAARRRTAAGATMPTYARACETLVVCCAAGALATGRLRGQPPAAAAHLPQAFICTAPGLGVL